MENQQFQFKSTSIATVYRISKTAFGQRRGHYQAGSNINRSKGRF